MVKRVHPQHTAQQRAFPAATQKRPFTKTDFAATHYAAVAGILLCLLSSIAKAVLTGDGEYRFCDILLGIDILRMGHFGAVFGSRSQSRQQFRRSLEAAYGESKGLFVLSWLGGFLVASILGVRYRTLFSDPLTGFRIYRRARLTPTFRQRLLAEKPVEVTDLIKLLITSEIEVGEFPVSYRFFSGFTDPSRRFKRGLRNLFRLLT
jgi:hypothetical protein